MLIGTLHEGSRPFKNASSTEPLIINLRSFKSIVCPSVDGSEHIILNKISASHNSIFFVLSCAWLHLSNPHEYAVLTQHTHPDGQSFLSKICPALPVVHGIIYLYP